MHTLIEARGAGMCMSWPSRVRTGMLSLKRLRRGEMTRFERFRRDWLTWPWCLRCGKRVLWIGWVKCCTKCGTQEHG